MTRTLVVVFLAIAIAERTIGQPALPTTYSEDRPQGVEPDVNPDEEVVDRHPLDELLIEEADRPEPDVPARYVNWPFSVQYQSPQVRIRLVNSLLDSPPDHADWSYLKPTAVKRDAKYYYDANELGTETMDRPENPEQPTHEDVREQEQPAMVPAERYQQENNPIGSRLAEDPSDPPFISSRNIITAPSLCPVGQRKDSKGVCRTVVHM